MIDRIGLAEFLRLRREALQPEDVGLPRGLRRRTAGLRREEVAALCHMSTDYYACASSVKPSERTTGSARTTARSEQASPPRARVVARSSRTLAGSWTAPAGRQGATAADSPASAPRP